MSLIASAYAELPRLRTITISVAQRSTWAHYDDCYHGAMRTRTSSPGKTSRQIKMYNASQK
ncbi:hypothetical protein IF2G_00628 [Cordyceps javanica]|nr:hypothetical protein IF2G_00628 [Cordyceps javanica]